MPTCILIHMTVQILQKETYLTMLENSVGSHQYRTLWADVDGVTKDILDNGQLSCAFFVSSILNHFRLIDTPHARTEGLVRDMERNGWTKTDAPVPGCVVVWEAQEQKSGVYPHSGFCLTSTEVLSHTDATQTPQKHHVTFGEKEDGTPKRNITSIYTHDFLNS